MTGKFRHELLETMDSVVRAAQAEGRPAQTGPAEIDAVCGASYKS